ncbi:DUF2797 domain-containing protein [Alkalimarinus sediminis]|uniref:DUF2797 domain-containing protein n=1 Tax=Alkalimarinus sediminis TaxID=1632866 RepID=A0A9E8HQC9_9ALTE|nr:DUF2797 domain-containing protein [Alkalimarinus sediminis]UZW76788.1 DUF2797 domain-containing protein [Alkalimarinus sediminis]
MAVSLEQPISYTLILGDSSLNLNELVGEQIKIQYQGKITCSNCGRNTKKSFSQGYCYPCFSKLASCDTCIMSPEKCHYAAGTCREPEWGETHCMTPHIVYLANSSGVKVGITRETQVPTRWIDQGAIEAIPVFRVSTRHLSGLVEVVFKQHVTDRTNWRAMLKGQVAELDMLAERDRLLALVDADIQQIRDAHPEEVIELVDVEHKTPMQYPVDVWPEKVVSLNLDKTPEVSGQLMGIKGQYLILDSGCINIRKFGSYHVEVSRY